jgi:uncharacterized repeat protein (TIGR03803 family)
MNVEDFARCAFGLFASALMLAGCGSVPLPSSLGVSDAAKSRVVSNAAYQSLYSFQGPPDGEQPQAGLTYFQGTLYGTTNLGGLTGSNCAACGTVYRIGTDARENVLYRFQGPPDGEYPESDLTPARKHAYYLGTTYSGGSGCSGSCGTIFKIAPNGSEHVLYSFKGGIDGSHPKGGVFVVNSALDYGTTWAGGRYGDGTVYVLKNSSEEGVLHSFDGSTGDGTKPIGDLISIGSNFYGVTETGGKYNAGSVFEIGTPGGVERVIHSFKPAVDGSDPVGLTEFNGTFYGATSAGAAFARGSVFALDQSGHFRVVHNFKGHPDDGAYPQAPPIVVKGKLYGTTRGGGAHGNGIVYRLTPTGDESVLYSFQPVPDGVSPFAPLTYVYGVLYGTTLNGGARHAAYGTVFRLLP